MAFREFHIYDLKGSWLHVNCNLKFPVQNCHYYANQKYCSIYQHF